MKIVIESPLAGDFQKNFRFLLWCCRAVWIEDTCQAIASHMLNPWFMDDLEPSERQAGIDNPWVWGPGVKHVFFEDLGMSRGMGFAMARCERDSLPRDILRLSEYSPRCWKQFEAGEWPPHTPGFEVKT